MNNEIVANEYEVQEVVDNRINDDGSVDYRVHWRDFDPSHDDWVASANMSCPNRIEEYNAREVEKIKQQVKKIGKSVNVGQNMVAQIIRVHRKSVKSDYKALAARVACLEASGFAQPPEQPEQQQPEPVEIEVPGLDQVDPPEVESPQSNASIACAQQSKKSLQHKNSCVRFAANK